MIANTLHESQLMNKAVIDESFVKDNAPLLKDAHATCVSIVFTTMGYNKLIAIAPNNVSYAKTALPNLLSSKAILGYIFNQGPKRRWDTICHC